MNPTPGTLLDMFANNERSLRRMCWREFRLSHDDAEEVLQRTRIALDRVDRRAEGPAHPWSFIVAVLSNEFLAMRREGHADNPPPSPADVRVVTRSREPDEIENYRAALLAAATLTDILRDAWLARVILGLHAKEAALLLSTDPALIDSRLSSARKEIREILLTPPPTVTRLVRDELRASDRVASRC